MTYIKLNITAYPTPAKFELYDWLRDQRWHADDDFWMGVWGGPEEYRISMTFACPRKAALFKLTWGGQ
jgi:hypothetical protein